MLFRLIRPQHLHVTIVDVSIIIVNIVVIIFILNTVVTTIIIIIIITLRLVEQGQCWLQSQDDFTAVCRRIVAQAYAPPE